MNGFRLPLFSLVLAFLLAGCSDDDGGGGQSFSIQSLPSRVGTSWTYDRLAAPENVRILDPNAEFSLDTLQSAINVTVAKIVTFNDPGGAVIPTSEFLTRETMLRPTHSSSAGYTYYCVTDSGWYRHGYVGGGPVAPPLMKRPHTTLTFAGRHFGTLAELLQEYGVFSAPAGSDSVIREIPPLFEFPLPLSSPRAWTYRARGNPFFIGKIAERDTTVSVGGASYRCVVIRWWYDRNGDSVPDPDLEILDYVSSLGFLRRTVVTKDILISTTTSPEAVAIADIRDTFTLTAIAMP